MKDCIVYLVFQLRSSGYEVRFTWPNLLHINWSHHESHYVTQQSPILQAMAPTAPPPLARAIGGSQKKKSAAAQAASSGVSSQAVSFNEAIEILNSTPATFGLGAPPMRSFEAMGGLAGGSSGIAAPARRAADYVPPAAFVQQMDRPERVPPPRNGVQHKTMSNGSGASGASGDVLADLWPM